MWPGSAFGLPMLPPATCQKLSNHMDEFGKLRGVTVKSELVCMAWRSQDMWAICLCSCLTLLTRLWTWKRFRRPIED